MPGSGMSRAAPRRGQRLPQRLGEVDAAVHLDGDAVELQPVGQLGDDPLAPGGAVGGGLVVDLDARAG